MHRVRRAVWALTLSALVGSLAGVGASGTPAAAAPAGNGEVIAFLVRGTGNGHGRGLSQWGAYGRAVDGGQSWQQILDAYYGGTTNGNRSEPNMTIRLTDWDGVTTFGVVSKVGAASWTGVPGAHVSMYAVEVAANRFDVFAAETAACPGGAVALAVPTVDLAIGASGDAVRQLQTLLKHFGATLSVDGSFGPVTETALKTFQTGNGLVSDGVWQNPDWTKAQQLLAAEGTPTWTKLNAAAVTGPIVFDTTVDQSVAAAGSVLGACESNGSITHYRGSLALRDTTDGNRVVNTVDVENYLRGVVPKESSASWGSAGGGAGMNALRAQAVAARSFALSQNRYAPWGKTCDTTSCQVYGGAAARGSASVSSATSVEHPLTDQAIAETAGVVRLKNGAVVSTEFSASNGPRTAGGTFPAVDDPWDDVPGNPNHRWARVIDADLVTAKYGLSSANAVATVPDPAAGYDGIWDNQVVSGGTTLATAWDFRNAFSLPSPGFELIPVTRSVTSTMRFSMIGDSVGVSVAGLDTSELPVLLEGVHASTTFDVVGGRRTQGGGIGDGVIAANAVPAGTELVLVELGYNDDPATMPGRIDAVMSALRSRGVGRVAWVTVSERRPAFTATNAAIEAAVGRWPELSVVDWEAASQHAAADRWFADDVHLTATGQAEFASFLRDQVLALTDDNFVPPPTPRRLVAGHPLHVPVLGTDGVPASGVAGVALNVTAVGPVGPGWLRAWPCGSPEPATSSVNYLSAGAVEPNAVVVPVDATGEVCISTMTTTDVIVDVSGWFDSGLRPATGRLIDTRETAVSVTPGSPLRVPVTGSWGVPTDGVAGVALNVTAVETTGPGWLRVWPCDSPEPSTSSVNFSSSGAVEPNAVVIPVDASGEACIASLVPTEVIVDVAGWFDGAIRSATGRLIDTRELADGTARSVQPLSPLRVSVLGHFGVPAGAVGVALNVTAVDPSGPGWLRVWPCGSPEPTTSSVNYSKAGAVEPNAVVVPVDTTGEVCVATLVATEVIVDVSAWFDAALRPAAGRLVDTRDGTGPIPPR